MPYPGTSGSNAIGVLGRASVALASLLLTLVHGATGSDARGFASFDAARDLVYALERLGLTAIATDDPAERGTFLAALYIPRSQLFVVSARHPSAEAVAERVANHQYQEVYLELYGSPDTRDKFFVRDSGANGILSALPGSDNVDVLYENGDRLTLFNGDAEGQNLTESAYDEKWASADNRYARILTLLKAKLDESPTGSPSLTSNGPVSPFRHVHGRHPRIVPFTAEISGPDRMAN